MCVRDCLVFASATCFVFSPANFTFLLCTVRLINAEFIDTGVLASYVINEYDSDKLYYGRLVNFLLSGQPFVKMVVSISVMLICSFYHRVQ